MSDIASIATWCYCNTLTLALTLGKSIPAFDLSLNNVPTVNISKMNQTLNHREEFDKVKSKTYV